MARLVVVTTASPADGFRLAGCPTVVAPAGRRVAAFLQDVSAGDVGLVLVTADVWAAVEPRARDQFERLTRPVVMPIPAGVGGEVSPARALLGEMLERAIGFRISLDGDVR